MLTDKQIEEWRLRRYDPSGRLVEAGFKWYQVRPGTYNRMTWIGLTLLFASVVVFVFAIIAVAVSEPFVAVISFAVSVLCAYAVYRMDRASKRLAYQWVEVSFCADGQIIMLDPTVPDVRKQPSTYALEKTLESLISIEAAPATAIGGGHGHITIQGLTVASYVVQFVFKDGQVAAVAVNLVKEGDARLIAVQLNLALQEIRQVIATHNREAAMGRPPRRA